jgi:hypothetical protein
MTVKTRVVITKVWPQCVAQHFFFSSDRHIVML